MAGTGTGADAGSPSNTGTGEQQAPKSDTGAKDKGKEIRSGPWLNAWHDPVAGMVSYSQFMSLVDMHADGDHRLVMVDLKSRIRIYQGTTIRWQQDLLDIPVAVECFYHEAASPAVPSMAVASANQVYIYRYLRPYLKFSLPPVPIEAAEAEIWEAVAQDGMDYSHAVQRLGDARQDGIPLSSRSVELLALEDSDQQREFVEQNKSVPLVQHTSITCMSVIKQQMDEPSAVSMLILGTESKNIYFLDPSGTRIVQKVDLDSEPIFLSVVGLYSVEYRVTVACRDAKIYTIKNGSVLHNVIELETMPVGLIRMDKNIHVGCMDNVVHSYHFKGKKNHTVFLPHPISCMTAMTGTRAKSFKALLVALKNGDIRMYNGKQLLHVLTTSDSVVGMLYGQFGREEGALVISFASGAVGVRILQRTASLENAQADAGPPPEQDVPLDIPKKTKLYVEQTSREREQAVEMHRTFQRDLCKLRLTTARSYVKLLGSGYGPVSFMGGAQIRLNAQVQGVGPEFKILIRIQNTGANILYDIPVTVSTNQALYRVHRPAQYLPLLVPRQLYLLEVPLTCINEQQGTDVVRVFLCSTDSHVPIISASVNMPISEERLPMD
mmetsp:Transcript_76152/g.174445  ORF Transcript_76152/g.174445 Transcript_76152/m.174445 type:complete len:608 (-) Transcript_76152:73-1896(-)